MGGHFEPSRGKDPSPRRWNGHGLLYPPRWGALASSDPANQREAQVEHSGKQEEEIPVSAGSGRPGRAARAGTQLTSRVGTGRVGVRSSDRLSPSDRVEPCPSRPFPAEGPRRGPCSGTPAEALQGGYVAARTKNATMKAGFEPAESPPWQRLDEQLGARLRGEQKHHSTRGSRVIPQRSTNLAQPCLTSEIGRDRVCSEWYDRGMPILRS